MLTVVRKCHVYGLNLVIKSETLKSLDHLASVNFSGGWACLPGILQSVPDKPLLKYKKNLFKEKT